LSRIPDLGEGFKNIANVLSDFDIALDDADAILKIEGKSLERANKENPAWQAYYDQKRIELKTLLEYMEMQVQRTRGRLFKSYTETYPRELSDRAKDKYIDNEEAYLTIYEIYLEVKEMYNRYQAVVDAFTSRGYALNNITKIRVASLEDVMM
jgi:hypothetical protein